MDVELPEPYREALARGDAREVADLAAAQPPERFGRALARAALSRFSEARADLEAALPALGDACRVELALLDVVERSDLAGALAACEEVAARAAAGSRLAARAAHVRGLALGKERQHEAACESLLEALRAYRERGDGRGLGEVYDTLGNLYAAEGLLELASTHYALSIAEKARSGDRRGLGFTLGALGRLNLRAGRCEEALRCFELDLELARELGEAEAEAQMHGDVGRARAGLGDLRGAIASCAAGLEIAVARGLRAKELFLRRDLALALVALGRETGDEARLSEAEAELARAAAALGTGGERYHGTLLELARGELLLARGEDGALEVLEACVRELARARLPDLEIPALVSLAEALAARRLTNNAARCLERALKRARRDGYARYLPVIREALVRLELVEPLAEERGRLDLGPGADHGPDGYTNLRIVGEGTFGTVHRAYDSRSGSKVAVKLLRLDALYDERERKRLLHSMRLELEASTRVRHPGVARVLAVGEDMAGRTYIVQEFVDGHTLRKEIPAGPTSDLARVAAAGADIAHALDALHQGEVVHRDLKPENVILRHEDGRPVLVDFGIARVPTLPDALGAPAVVGTFPYMSPEQVQGKPVDGSTDVYALGVLLYEWLAGIRPIRFPVSTYEAVVARIVSEPAPPLSEFRPGLPHELVELLALMLHKHHRRRPPAAQVAELLAELARETAR